MHATERPSSLILFWLLILCAYVKRGILGSVLHCRWKIPVKQMMKALQHCTIPSVLVTLTLFSFLLNSDVMSMLPTQMDGTTSVIFPKVYVQ